LVLPGTLSQNFFGTPGSSRTVSVAPNYGAVARAEKLREEFHRDMLSASGIFCLHRRESNRNNPMRRNWFPFNPAVDGALESPRDFYDFLVRWDATASTVFEVPANPGMSNVAQAPHASIYLTTFSANRDRLVILSLYEVDVIRYANVRPWGLYASVRKYAPDAANPTAVLASLYGGYEVFYQPSIRNPTSPAQFASDGFAPLFVTFERSIRKSVVEDHVLGQDRFKAAAERPFYFVWWPDPAMPNLAAENPSGLPREARRAYNHMGGRTSFMFTVPMFPAL
jgi:hypothetical protein